ncbi:MAG: serine/threonine protein kinase [Pseudodesulfovibrio sp.]|nr:serine/threonine protein kinase [Pseudodesulfovibrio sp.]
MPSVKELVKQYQPDLHVRDYGRVVVDTSEFMSIDSGDVIAIDGKHYLVFRDAVERGFTYTDTKYWVKKCKELETGDAKLLKLVFHESFYLEYGCVKIKCFRSPRKEARMLDLVHGDTRFMQGHSARDSAGNQVRIIDIIQGKRIDQVVANIPTDHETYFHDHYPAILDRFIGACEAIAYLHDKGERHGDINLDHLMKEHATGAYRWIDFDYAYEAYANPFALDLFGLGRILACITGKWLYSPQTLLELEIKADISQLDNEDFSCVHKNEIMNLKKLFPYIPTRLNNVLLHFSEKSEVFYDTAWEFTEELRTCQDPDQ